MIRVLIADDSPVFLEVLRDVLGADPEFEIVAEASDGADAVDQTTRTRPDVVLLDVLMPVLDGFEAVTSIMAHAPTPVLMLTADARGRSGELAFEALRRGAIDLVAKPTHWPLSPAEAEALRERVRMTARARPIRHLDGRWRRPRDSSARPIRQLAKVVGIVSSTGGPAALQSLLVDFASGLDAGIAVVQHLPPGFVGNLARWLGTVGTIDVSVARDGDRCEPGRLLLAPDGAHMTLDSVARVHLSEAPHDVVHRPSGDLLLASIAESFGANGAGVVLTGMGRDGSRGLRAIREAGGKTFAQDEASSVVFGMPKAAADAGAVQRFIALEDIAGTLRTAVGTRRHAG